MDRQSIDKVLTTTRSVRKRLDLTRPVEPEVLIECLEIAAQAPSGSDGQHWHFVIVTDPEPKAAVGEWYRRSFYAYAGGVRPPADQMNKLRDSSFYLADHMHEVPALVLFCYTGRVEDPSPFAQAGFYGSILPAAWSFMLALRARGLGSAWTTLHLRYEQETAQLLGIPDHITQTVLLPVAYYTGDDFRPAPRKPLRERIHWNRWGHHE